MVRALPGGPTARRVFVLSLKAGGTGLNLTARQPRHPLRPLVEPRGRGSGHRPRLPHRPDPPVQVHKLICAGTVEERIDALITRSGRSPSRINAGEGALTELSDAELAEAGQAAGAAAPHTCRATYRSLSLSKRDDGPRPFDNLKDRRPAQRLFSAGSR